MSDSNGEELPWTLVFVSSQDDLTIEASKMYSRDFIYGKGWICEQLVLLQSLIIATIITIHVEKSTSLRVNPKQTVSFQNGHASFETEADL